ncbi:MAG: 4-hydroxythreonine-4-phosphate dehydrogenase PdxA [Flavobacteriales bacterium]|nr:4-hydroxythreonine-4-phosphate dehydrogenase PdxA [Flavobacteriales bacterium]
MGKFLKLGVSIGDPNGIGLEIIIKAFLHQKTLNEFIAIVYSNVEIIEFHLAHLKLDLEINVIKSISESLNGKLNVFEISSSNFKVDFGKSNTQSGDIAFRSLITASKHIIENKIDCLVTAPIDKNTIQSKNFKFNGHTEYLTKISNKNNSLMLMVHQNLKVGVVTNHLSIAQVAEAISIELILTKIAILEKSLKNDFNIKTPKIALLGLNPHAGDGGIIGIEEITIIKPAIKIANEKKFRVFGPFPADGFFASEKHKEFDAVLGMYHDQGLIPFKMLSKNQGVNFTAGLPIIRTSPDHGTASDIAGKNKASFKSFMNALYLSKDIYNNRKRQ